MFRDCRLTTIIYQQQGRYCYLKYSSNASLEIKKIFWKCANKNVVFDCFISFIHWYIFFGFDSYLSLHFNGRYGSNSWCVQCIRNDRFKKIQPCSRKLIRKSRARIYFNLLIVPKCVFVIKHCVHVLLNFSWCFLFLRKNGFSQLHVKNNIIWGSPSPRIREKPPSCLNYQFLC